MTGVKNGYCAHSFVVRSWASGHIIPVIVSLIVKSKAWSLYDDTVSTLFVPQLVQRNRQPGIFLITWEVVRVVLHLYSLCFMKFLARRSLGICTESLASALIVIKVTYIPSLIVLSFQLFSWVRFYSCEQFSSY